MGSLMIKMEIRTPGAGIIRWGSSTNTGGEEIGQIGLLGMGEGDNRPAYSNSRK